MNKHQMKLRKQRDPSSWDGRSYEDEEKHIQKLMEDSRTLETKYVPSWKRTDYIKSKAFN